LLGEEKIATWNYYLGLPLFVENIDGTSLRKIIKINSNDDP